MNISAVKERIHDYINHADERFLNLVYALIQADMREEVYNLSDEEIKHLEERLANYEATRTSYLLGMRWKSGCESEETVHHTIG